MFKALTHPRSLLCPHTHTFCLRLCQVIISYLKQLELLYGQRNRHRLAGFLYLWVVSICCLRCMEDVKCPHENNSNAGMKRNTMQCVLIIWKWTFNENHAACWTHFEVFFYFSNLVCFHRNYWTDQWNLQWHFSGTNAWISLKNKKYLMACTKWRCWAWKTSCWWGLEDSWKMLSSYINGNGGLLKRDS